MNPSTAIDLADRAAGGIDRYGTNYVLVVVSLLLVMALLFVWRAKERVQSEKDAAVREHYQQMLALVEEKTEIENKVLNALQLVISSKRGERC